MKTRKYLERMLAVLLAALLMAGFVPVQAGAADDWRGTTGMADTSGRLAGVSYTNKCIVIENWPTDEKGAPLGDNDVTLWDIFIGGSITSAVIIEPPGWYSSEPVMNGEYVLLPGESGIGVDPDGVSRLIENIDLRDIPQQYPMDNYTDRVLVTPNGVLPYEAFHNTGGGAGGGYFSWYRSTEFLNNCRYIAFSSSVAVDYYERGGDVLIATAEGRLEPNNTYANKKYFNFRLYNNYPYEITWHVPYDKTTKGYERGLDAIMHLTDTEGNVWRTERFSSSMSPRELVEAKQSRGFFYWILYIFFFGWLWM